MNMFQNEDYRYCATEESSFTQLTPHVTPHVKVIIAPQTNIIYTV